MGFGISCKESNNPSFHRQDSVPCGTLGRQEVFNQTYRKVVLKQFPGVSIF